MAESDSPPGREQEDVPGAWTCPICARPQALQGSIRVFQVATTPEPLYQYTRRITRQHCRCDPGTILEAWHRQEHRQAHRQEQETPDGGGRQPPGA